MACMDYCETRPCAVVDQELLTIMGKPMQLYRAIALIAVVLIVVLAAGYAAAEHAELETSASSALQP